ncbi:MAG: FG-GAP-like repeat-containing protein [Saprospiraceae bacterium]
MLQYILGTMGQAKCGVDMNGDFLDDITRIGPDGIYFDFQKPDGSFLHRFVPHAIEVLPVWSICSGDLDQDGYNDLVFGGVSRVSFLKSRDNVTSFEESIMPDFIYSQRTTLSDIDNDGDLDAFICRDDGMSQAFRNDGVGNMTKDQTLINTANLPGNYSAIWTDYNNDGHTDLYISKCLANGLPGNPARTNLLYRNNGDGTFTETGAQAGLDDNAQSWSTVFEDFDNDGDFDAFIVNHDQGNRLMKNNGDGTFTNVISDSGIDELDLSSFENTSGDFNNDGFIDIFSELHNELYLGNGDLTFTGQTLPFTPGAIGDFNNDGFLDVTYRSQLWINKGNENHWIKLNLFGLESNLNGIGARVEIYGTWGVQIRELRAGQSFSPMNTLSLHFGLGLADVIDKLVVKWPGGTVTEMFNLTTDTTYLIPEAPCFRSPEPATISGKAALCPGDSVKLIAPAGYSFYEWTGGMTQSSIWINKPGIYQVVYVDTSGCAGISLPAEITLADAILPEITILNGDEKNCEGTEVLLSSSSGLSSYWSNGVQDTGIISVTSPGIYTVSRDSICGQGQLVSGALSIAFYTAPPPQADAFIITSGDSVLLESSGEHCAWYDAPVGGNLLSDECNFQTPPFFSDTVFYVENQYLFPGEIQSGGKPDSMGFGGLITANKSMHFTAIQPFILLSTTMYIPDQANEGIRTIQLTSGNEILAEKSVFLLKGKNEVTLDFRIPIGSYALQCDQHDQFLNIGALDYPYPLGDAGQLDSSSTGLNFYPYFYNWTIQKEDINCTSIRTAVNIDVTGLSNTPLHSGFTIFPVPASHSLHILFDELLNTIPEVIIRDFLGRPLIIRRTIPQNDYMTLDISALPPGIYHMHVLINGTSASRLFMIQR